MALAVRTFGQKLLLEKEFNRIKSSNIEDWERYNLHQAKAWKGAENNYLPLIGMCAQDVRDTFSTVDHWLFHIPLKAVSIGKTDEEKIQALVKWSEFLIGWGFPISFEKEDDSIRVISAEKLKELYTVTVYIQKSTVEIGSSSPNSILNSDYVTVKCVNKDYKSQLHLYATWALFRYIYTTEECNKIDEYVKRNYPGKPNTIGIVPLFFKFIKDYPDENAWDLLSAACYIAPVLKDMFYDNYYGHLTTGWLMPNLDVYLKSICNPESSRISSLDIAKHSVVLYNKTESIAKQEGLAKVELKRILKENLVPAFIKKVKLINKSNPTGNKTYVS